MVYEERHPDGRGQSLSERTEPMLYPSRLPLPLNQGSLFRKICQVLSKNLAFYENQQTPPRHLTIQVAITPVRREIASNRDQSWTQNALKPLYKLLFDCIYPLILRYLPFFREGVTAKFLSLESDHNPPCL